jgi:hypothetical protein
MSSKMKNVLSLLLLIVVGLFIYFPSLDILPYMAEGDTGRDLYAYEMTLEGKTPYRDYFYNYGPLMPYYYALCFKFFGIKIPSVLFGRMILNMLSGLFLFGCLRLFFRPIVAILCVWWFWSFNQDFSYGRGLPAFPDHVCLNAKARRSKGVDHAGTGGRALFAIAGQGEHRDGGVIGGRHFGRDHQSGQQEKEI